MYTTAEVATHIGVSKNTLLRWLAEGRLAEVARDWRNWRVWSEADLARARDLRDHLHLTLPTAAPPPPPPPPPTAGEAPKPMPVGEYAADLGRLGQGRAFRGEAARPAAKTAAVTLYADELSGLDSARRFRAARESRHAT